MKLLMLDVLEPEFKSRALELLTKLRKDHGIIMVPYQTRRTPHEQAIFWRQSRPKNLIVKAIKMLRASGAPFLARTLETVGPRSGPHVTNALPGESWHQWNMALDCYWELNGKAIWSTATRSNGVNGYKIYAREASKFGLTSLGAKFRWDWNHVQLPQADSPLSFKSWAQIDKAMKEKYS